MPPSSTKREQYTPNGTLTGWRLLLDRPNTPARVQSAVRARRTQSYSTNANTSMTKPSRPGFDSSDDSGDDSPSDDGPVQPVAREAMSLDQSLERVEQLRRKVEELEEEATVTIEGEAALLTPDQADRALGVARLKLGEFSARAAVLLSRALYEADEEAGEGEHQEEGGDGDGSLPAEELDALLRGVAVAASQWIADELLRREQSQEAWGPSDGWEAGDDLEAVRGRLGELSTLAVGELHREVESLERARASAPGQAVPRLAEARSELQRASARASLWKEEEMQWLQEQLDVDLDPEARAVLEEELGEAFADKEWFALVADATVCSHPSHRSRYSYALHPSHSTFPPLSPSHHSHACLAPRAPSLASPSTLMHVSPPA
jgi:hypothetical protein